MICFLKRINNLFYGVKKEGEDINKYNKKII